MNKKPFYMTSVAGTVSAIMLTAASFGMMSDANATSSIASANGTTNCAACHAGGVTNTTTGQAGIKNFCLGKYPNGGGQFNASFVCTPQLPAKTFTGAVGSATGVAATDVLTVNCPAGTTQLAVAVKDLAPVKAAVVSIQTTKGFAASPLTADTVDGDAKFSPEAPLQAGVGVYNVLINKQLSSAVGPEGYTAQFACRNAANANLATPGAVVKQNK